MTDSQIIAIAIVFVAALGSILFNNSRISDLRSTTDSRMSELRSDMNKRFDDVNRHIEDKFQRLDQKLDHLIEISASHESRIYKLEHPQ